LKTYKSTFSDYKVLKTTKRTVLSTADVARLFNVTETTVKRWADDGTLKCQKTPGGHRKFFMKHVAEFASTHNLEPSGALTLTAADGMAHGIEVAVLERDFSALTNAFVDKALSPDQTDLYHFFSYLYQHQLQLWEIYDRVLGPGMQEIGERWIRQEIGINHEHRASYEVLDALAKLQAQVLIREPIGHSVICACLEDELHEIGLRCASYLFESEGWKVYYLGARTPAASLIAAMEELHPSVLCISVTNLEGNGRLRAGLQQVRGAAEARNVTVIFGGRAALQIPAASAPGGGVYATAHDLRAFSHQFVRDNVRHNGEGHA
jgi:excisionase family DNA binding protein